MTDAATAARLNPGTTAPLSRRLREGTREVHARVETTASFNRLIVVRIPQPDSESSLETRERFHRARGEYREVYRRFLIAAHGFESAVDAALADSPAYGLAETSGYPTELHPPCALIRDDLGRVFGAGAAEEVGVMDGLATIRTLPQLVGTEYVRRGSRAGGAVIAAVVHHNLGLTRETGASFLMQYGNQTRSVITRFKDWADGLDLSEDDSRIAVDAAIATFETIQGWHTHLDERFSRT